MTNGAWRWEGRLCAGAKKAVVILCLFALTARQAEASHCAERTFKEEKINLFLCQNSSGGYSEIRTLLYKAKTIVLDDYIKEKIAKGELQDKKFEIQIWSRMLSNLHLYLTQGHNGYFVSISDYPSLSELKTIVDYFSRPDWKPFVAEFNHRKVGETEEEGEKRYYANEQKIYNFYKSNNEKEPIAYQPFTVWEKDGVSLQFLGDTLRYLIYGTPLSFKADEILPVKIQDRYLFFEQDSIFVVQDLQTINSIKREDSLFGDFSVNVHSEWVNIGWSEKNWVYSYSYEQNRFFKNENFKF